MADNLVAPSDACPTCGERDVDQLEWINDGERVQCHKCKTTYDPLDQPVEEYGGAFDGTTVTSDADPGL